MATKRATRQRKTTVSKKGTSKAEKRKQSDPACLKFLKSSHSAVRSHMGAATDLPTFLESAGGLSLNGRKRIAPREVFSLLAYE